jgi:hypothetical protein
MPKSAKIALASFLALAALFVLLWDFGVFEGKPKPPPSPTAGLTPDQQVQYKKEQDQRIEWEKKQKPPSGS